MAKTTKNQKPRSMAENDPDILYKRATTREGVNPSHAMRTAAEILDLLERLTIQTEKSAGKRITDETSRAAFVAFMLRTNMTPGTVCNMGATIQTTITTHTQRRYLVENVLQWRDEKNRDQKNKIKITVEAFL